jgi:AcrR family transcriptional regulator
MTARRETEPARGRETRMRIQAVAVELFTEQGYDKTSLREIAERLGVTKAALYYHFKSKEDIVASITEDYVGEVDDLIDWGRGQPATPQTRAEILRRYVAIVAEGHQVFRMLHQNQAASHSMSGASSHKELFKERITALTGLLAEPGSGRTGQLRPTMALGGISMGWIFFADQAADRDELCAEMLRIASDLTNASPPAASLAAPAG